MNELISFDTAKLAKEKGFNDVCQYAYWRNIEGNYNLVDNCDMENSELAEYNYTTPTQTHLKRWLREKHNTHLITKPEINGDFYTEVINLDDNVFIELEPLSSYENSLELGLIRAFDLIN